jgi:hypothetical protein
MRKMTTVRGIRMFWLLAVATVLSSRAPAVRSAEPDAGWQTKQPTSDNPVDPEATGIHIAPAATTTSILEQLVPPRSDTPADWVAPIEPLHWCGEPRILCPTVPLPPCHPVLPPHPYDLVGVPGFRSSGPIYRGPCEPRAGSRDDCSFPAIRRLHDAFVDHFYRPK